MQATGVGAPEIKLIATDLDGTLIGTANDFPLYSTFRDRVDDLRRRNNAVWAACTGRSFRSFWEFFSPMRTMGLMPDYVVIRHAYIFELTRFGYLPHVFWNLHIHLRLWVNKFNVRRAMNEWHRLVKGGSLGVSTVHHRGRLCLRFDSDESADVAADMLREKVKRYKHLRVFKYQREVDVRDVPFTKGLAVAELAAHLGIARESVLAIGNGNNDISMLAGDIAAYTGCPSNSEPEVMEVVHRSGGHIATGRSLAGVMEIIDATQSGSVHSDLPENWRPPEEQHNPLSGRSSRDQSRERSRAHWRRKATWWLFPAMAYTVLAVFDTFDVLPFGGLITRPFGWIALAAEKVMTRLY